MAPSKRNNLIDGYTSVQAVRRATTRSPATTTARPTSAPIPSAPPSATGAPVRRIAHTTVPSKRHILCYECGYSHTVTGKLHNSICPKCRKTLSTENRIVEGEWSGDIKTIGNIEIRPGAVVGEALFVAARISIAADVRQAELRATQSVELLTGARFDKARVETDHIRVPAGADVTASTPFECRHLDVEGALTARITATGVVTIHPGGVLDGSLTSNHLIVHEGGGLRASVRLTPPDQETPAHGPR